MALFGKKAAPKKAVAKKESKAVVAASTSKKDFSWVLEKPRITEKSTIVPELVNAYVFEVNARATAGDIKAAIFDLYKVMPTKVNVLPIAPKTISRMRRKGKTGVKGGGKKAYVYLKKGEKIEFA